MLDYNHQKHMAHEKREDGCHSPAAVLWWVKGTQAEPDLVYRVFSALCKTLTLTKTGYALFRNCKNIRSVALRLPNWKHNLRSTLHSWNASALP